VRFPQIAVVLFFVVGIALPIAAQSTNGIINGLVLDPSNSAIVGADILVINDATGVKYSSKTNSEGIYLLPNLPPGPYRLQVSKVGFKTLIKPDITLNVQDALSINFTLPIGAAIETVTVQGGAPLIDTESAAVSTVVDRQFAENLPMNGRSFQSLIDLAPGVVLTASTDTDSGQFSVNGQRANSNYWMVDGVSANVGSTSLLGGNGTASGATGTTSVFGGTNSLVSVDALQEFRIQTSTYAPEFGRTPGGQISIVTRSGTNRFHGAVFDYLRNDLFDANNWFNGYTNDPPLPKAEERQNDFGGTLGGPIRKGQTFFFLSYEGLRLRLPQTSLTTVPDLAARQNAPPLMQPFLNAYPIDSRQPDLGNGVAQFNASYSNPGTLDAASLRIDHRIKDAVNLFARYNYSPSEIVQRGLFFSALSAPLSSRVAVQTATIGSTWLISSTLNNDVRFNYSSSNATGRFVPDNFGGAVPLTGLPIPSQYNATDARFVFEIDSLAAQFYPIGTVVGNLQRQFNLVNTTSLQKRAHSLKFGVDYRRLSPEYSPFLYGQNIAITDIPSAENDSVRRSIITANTGVTPLLNNLSAFGQDTWRITSRLTSTYGLRWDVDFAPSSEQGPSISAVSDFSLSNLSQLALEPAGTPAFKTKYANFAPRLGLAYQLDQSPERGTVLRGGVGLFFDLATSEIGNVVNQSGYPFHATKFNPAGSFPLDAATASPPAIVAPDANNQGSIVAFDPRLRLPYTIQWNTTLEQGLGKNQTLKASYIGSAGRKLIQTAQIFSPNPNFGEAVLVANAGTSDYDALQLQFERRLVNGLEGLASYTWSHSIDTASAGSLGNPSNLPSKGGSPTQNRGPSDFDVRHAFSVGATYALPAPKLNPLSNAILRGWSIQNIAQIRSAVPVDVFDGNFFELTNGFTPNVRPDVVPGIPLYLYGSQYSGGKAINNTPNQGGAGCVGPFCPPAADMNGNPIRQGDLGRNALRAFGAIQWDFAVHRDLSLPEPFTLQFRAEMFNLLNHPNFAPPVSDISLPQFGLATEMLGQYLGGGNLGGGGLNPLYQIGGPRSIQFALRLSF
jgi:hypothetical protein